MLMNLKAEKKHTNNDYFRFVCCTMCQHIKPTQDVQHKPALRHLQVSYSEWHAARAREGL